MSELFHNLLFSTLSLVQRLRSLVDEMGELASRECQRQGAWGLLGEGIGAKLLCPDTGAVLTKDHIFGKTKKLWLNSAKTPSMIGGETAPSADKKLLLQQDQYI